MPYFSEVDEYKTYAGQAEDFHFSYNVNSGGGQSFLGGKFRNENGNVESASVLNGRIGVFQFRITGADGILRNISLEDDETKYEIKPRASGDNNMKLGVEDKKTPSVAIAAFLMLPKPCGVKRADNVDISPLCSKNYWLQSMWMSVDKTSSQIATLIPKDCVFSGGVDRNGDGQLRHFKVNFAKRISNIIAVAKSSKLDREILDCVDWFADVYEGRRDFVCADAISAIEDVMKCLQQKYPDRYSGLMDPLPVITELADINDVQPHADESVAGSNRLSVALKLFKERRDSWVDGKGKSGYEFVNATVRKLYAERKNWDVEKLYDADAFKKFCMEQTWMLQNGKGSYKCIAEYSDDERKKLITWLDETVVQLKAPLAEVVVKDNGFKGVTNKAVTELLMKFHPDQFCLCNGPTMEALVYLGLDPAVDGARDYDAYLQVMGCCAKILSRLRQMEIGAMLEGDDPADYIVVNEFIYFVHEHKDLIKEEVMRKQMKKDKPTQFDDAKRKLLKFDPDSKDDELLLRLLAALRAKPFAILAGHSGTGKSRYVKKLAYMTCNADELRKPGELPGNYLLLQVKPNWHDSTDLLGFRNAMDGNRYQKTALIEFLFRAYHFKDTPFFLCLDEMNLAPVEQYFAEFLSAMESEEPVPLNDITAEEDNLFELGCEWEDACDYLKAKKFSIPKNLFIVGTVNMDETTCQFSRKVLDRAFTLEMTDVDFTKFDGSNCKPPSYDDTIEEAKIQELLRGAFCADKLDEEDRQENSPLIKVQKTLEPTAFAIAYRFASEYTLLKRAFETFDPDKKMGLDALDQAILMKVLPRIAGEADYVEKVYGGKESEGLRGALAGKTVSLGKIATILKRAKEANAQYITFWP